MNKVELINAVAESAGMTKVDARKAVDAIVNVTKTIKIAAKKVVKFKPAANILK